MTERHRIVIAGAGGIGSAAALLLRELGDFEVDLYLGDADADKAREVAESISSGSSRSGAVEAFHLAPEGDDAEFQRALRGTHILLDCLPGSQAPRLARLARQNDLHYANLTEYVAETNQVTEIARGADRGFVLQTGLAPGYINILGNHLLRRFHEEHGVEKVETVAMRVGALTATAHPPHYYGFTWSSIGVATEYVKPAVVIRDYETATRPSLTDRKIILIDGIAYEEALTSGGAADLPTTYAGRVRNLDYKTLRYPGHYEWVQSQIDQLRGEGASEQELPDRLLNKMEEAVPFVDDDVVVVHAAVEGRDSRGTLQRLEASRRIRPRRVGLHPLKAIQTTTAAGLAESARLLLQEKPKGVCLQSQIDPEKFLNGPFISTIYG